MMPAMTVVGVAPTSLVNAVRTEGEDVSNVRRL